MTHGQLREEIKNALRAREEVRLSVLRGLLAACTNELVAQGKKPTDELSQESVMSLVRRGAKQRKDSIEQFGKGGRPDLAEKEKEELAILERMLPAQMSWEDIETVAKAKATELGISDRSGTNKLMGALMKDLTGNADGTLVKEVIDSMFA